MAPGIPFDYGKLGTPVMKPKGPQRNDRVAKLLGSIAQKKVVYKSAPLRWTEEEEELIMQLKDFGFNQLRKLADIHPGIVKYPKLAETMTQLVIEGHEDEVDGLVYEIVEGFWPEDADNTMALLSGKKKIENEFGFPEDNSLVWVYMETYLEGSRHPIEKSASFKRPKLINLKTALKGIGFACRTLKPGQCGRFLLPPSTMYGEEGQACTNSDQVRIPPSSTILLLLQVLKWIDQCVIDRFVALPDEKKKDLEIVNVYFNKFYAVAIDNYGRGDYETAMKYFDYTMDMLNGCEPVDSDKSDIDVEELMTKTLLNKAMCALKNKKTEEAMGFLDSATTLSELNYIPRYLFLKGKCLFLMGQHEEAYELLLRASRLEPYNNKIGRLLLKIDDEVRNILGNDFIELPIEDDDDDSASCSQRDMFTMKMKDVRKTMIMMQYTELKIKNLELQYSNYNTYKDIAKSIDDFDIEDRNEAGYYFIIPSKR